MMGLMVCWTLLTGALVVRKLLIAPESKMAQLLTESMLMLTVRRRVAAARAYGWVGFGQEGNKLFLYLYYWYRPPLPVRSYCTILDRVGQADLAWEGVPVERRC
jgi:hypothetical protein